MDTLILSKDSFEVIFKELLLTEINSHGILWVSCPLVLLLHTAEKEASRTIKYK